ncbi:hypothetical protein DFH08DRAFT_217688 [Mycena albidolilacea]|uniref:Uncharacterized protein n=1 Tax=Mycena albidolilacea TaxID=1033008 RepID=A0AAD7EPE5_9AGAR|nr:hypothetical protein DFH08DRAFT_217688 [Mycena albidolilacea]
MCGTCGQAGPVPGLSSMGRPFAGAPARTVRRGDCPLHQQTVSDFGTGCTYGRSVRAGGAKRGLCSAPRWSRRNPRDSRTRRCDPSRQRTRRLLVCVFLDSHPMTDVDYHEIVVMKNPNYTPPTDATGRQYGRGRTPHGFRPPVYCRCPTCVQALEDRNHFQVHYHHELDGGWSRDEILDAGPVNQATTLCPAANAVIGPAQEAALAVLLGLRPNVTIEEVRRTLQATSGNVAAARSALQG